MPVSRDVARIEAFSDAVFGFALTLLVVSLEVPRTYADMMASVRALPAFAASFAILLMIWQEHHNFFRRYGVHDGATIWINGLLLFVVLFYVYPLKFLMTMLIGPGGALFGGRPAGVAGHEVPRLMVMYGAGFVSVFLLMAALHWRALACFRRDPSPDVDMTGLRLHLGACFVHVAIGLLSMTIAGLGPLPWASGAAGVAYALIGPAFYAYYKWIGPRVMGAGA
ncbi:hypothetical protein TBR22_A50130 [Luteitalea sp. TBR-22]|uniref:TMEM175 family protein n=1 Tax=Luteitalea sp. TBR-22 TaxID=2802971 RepID=UPI001AFA5F68|nr:TMEM175 family protein [Luteitalea sp. TBR-22]BCS35779.1 hypothetical protein TBR22_A50130 [Luteitalea sp. TBR-22]